MPVAELQKLDPAIREDIYKVLPVEASVAARRSFGGTAPERVREQIAFWKERLS
jgi:argininosuccinate lyase